MREAEEKRRCLESLKNWRRKGGDEQLAGRIQDSANRIWLAGLGAFAKTQRDGMRIFEELVEEGAVVQEQAKKTAEGAFRDIKAKASESWDQLSWPPLQQALEEGVARALHTLSIPSKKDLDALSHHVAELTKVTKRLSDAMEESGRRTHG